MSKANVESTPFRFLAQPAQRALANAGIHDLEALAQHTEAEIHQLHGIGPNSLEKLRSMLANKGQTFKQEGTL